MNSKIFPFHICHKRDRLFEANALALCVRVCVWGGAWVLVCLRLFILSSSLQTAKRALFLSSVVSSLREPAKKKDITWKQQ